jgi:DNA-binding SARP family transcriptional activator
LTLAIHLFGQPKLLFDSVPLPFSAPPKTLPLLAYRQQMLERQQVAFAAVTRSRRHTSPPRRHLHQLQRALPPAPSEYPWLVGDTRTIRWNPQADAWLDVAEFERLASNPETLAEAIQLYTGDLLETVYDDWIFFERERLRELYFTSLGQLVFLHRTRRDYPAAIGFAQQLLGRDPFREDALRQLMALRYESGDRAGAIQEYETFERLLRQEMGVSPMPETQALHESVLRNARLPGVATPATPETAFTLDKPCASPALPFVGRTTEMEYLAACWNRAAHNHGGLALIGGEAGVGKTRLARELALLAEQQGGRVLYGGTAPGEPHPYQAVVEMLQAALPLLAALNSAPTHLAALSALVPDLKARRSLPNLPPLDPDRERTRLFDAVATCLAKLAERTAVDHPRRWHWARRPCGAVEFLARALLPARCFSWGPTATRKRLAFTRCAPCAAACKPKTWPDTCRSAVFPRRPSNPWYPKWPQTNRRLPSACTPKARATRCSSKCSGNPGRKPGRLQPRFLKRCFPKRRFRAGCAPPSPAAWSACRPQRTPTPR